MNYLDSSLVPLKLECGYASPVDLVKCGFFFFFLIFFQLHQQHREIPGLGAESGLQPPVYTMPQQCRIRAMSATYTTAHGNDGSPTHWTKPGIRLTSSWILVGFVNRWAMKGSPWIDCQVSLVKDSGDADDDNVNSIYYQSPWS